MRPWTAMQVKGMRKCIARGTAGASVGFAPTDDWQAVFAVQGTPPYLPRLGLSWFFWTKGRASGPGLPDAV